MILRQSLEDSAIPGVTSEDAARWLVINVKNQYWSGERPQKQLRCNHGLDQASALIRAGHGTAVIGAEQTATST